MIGDVRASEVKVSSELRRVAGLLQEIEQDARAGRISHRATESVHDIKARRNSQHTVTIQCRLTIVDQGQRAVACRS